MNFSQQPLEKRSAGNSGKKDNINAEALRLELAEHAKEFKVSWVHLGQGLFGVHRDKMYHAWGYEKFEDYVIRELGLKKPLALKLVKTYLFVEEQEPAYLRKEFSEAREAVVVPGMEGLDVLRLARRRNELTKEDYIKLRKDIFEKGKDASLVKKDLSAMIKERKQVNPDEERERRNQASIKRFLSALKNFKNDMDNLKLIDADIVEEAEQLLNKIEEKYV